GSGPAYFFYMAEALRDAAVKLGIKNEHALKLAVETLVGSGALLETLGAQPNVLRQRITSKKGTTEAALRVLDSKRFSHIFAKAVEAAARQAKDLSKGA
ncbi:MAG: pyrroline-5-carboxylate reductase, partial [Candidatus Omnitrophica bacterium]|nr:pyrroline-5-carboxylate reductase [Candidatus Omnitrophota bacterium]